MRTVRALIVREYPNYDVLYFVLPLMDPNPSLDLSAAVDVYSDWIDACDAVAKHAAGNDMETTTRGATDGSPGPVRRGADRDELGQAEAGLDDY
ncbi:hypothetical protein GX48_02206 [Paracoccidioides brasiliensis]|nr:hypothetical protein GX48_02206 [Paracoccidioides brasiliensis]